MIQMEFILAKTAWINQVGTMTKKEHIILLLILKLSIKKKVKINNPKIIKRLNQMQISIRIKIQNN